MTAKIEFDIQKVRGPLVGKNNVELLVDGKGVGSGSFGQTIVADLAPGRHHIQAILHSWIKRESKSLEVDVAPNSTVKITGKYSRLWGNVRISA